jgi:hypothetical protein
MLKWLVGVAIVLALAPFVTGATKHDFQTGKLINIDFEERLISGTSFRWAILPCKSAVSYTVQEVIGCGATPVTPDTV